MKNARFFLTYLLVPLLVMGALLGLVAGDGKPVAAAAKPIAIVIDGEEVPSDVAPRIVAGRTLVPLRVISEHLGAVVVWNQTDKSVTVTAGGRNILLHIDNKQASIDGQAVNLDVAPAIYQNRTLVPLRFLGESLGAIVHWDNDARRVLVRSPHAVLSAVDVVPANGRGKIVLRLSTPAEYRISYLDKQGDQPPRAVVSLAGVRSNLAGNEFEVGLGGVVRGRVVPVQDKQESVQVIFDLNRQLTLTAQRGDNGKDIVLEVPYQVYGLRYGHTEAGQAVFIEANGPVSARSMTLTDPHRIVVDIADSLAAPELPQVFEVGSGLVPRIRTSQFDASTVRVVIDLQQHAGHTMTVQDNRITVHIHQPGSSGQPITAPGGGTVVPIGRGVLAGKRIVVDAGHGGKDPGSISVSGIHEKVLTLATAKMLQAILTEAGAEVVMTRTGDQYVDLYERAGLANQVGAHAFVSIHMNSYHNPGLSGTETYHHPKAVEGRRLAKLVHEELLNELGRQDRGVRAADFVVLRETAMPAVLVEAGYLSNPDEERLLIDSSVQLRIAEAIFRALVRFFQ